MESNEEMLISVSIIVPTFNRLTELRETLASLDLQAYRNFEIVVVDDGSTDGTFEFLSNCEFDNLRCIHLLENVGESQAVNVGFMECVYPFVAVVSSDDPQRQDWLSEMVKYISSNPGYIFYYPNLRIIDADGVFIQDVELFEWDRRLQLRKMICMASAGTILNFRDFEKPSELRDKKVKFPSDLIQFLNLIKQGNGIKVPHAIGIWRDNPLSLTNQRDQVSRAIEFINVCDLWILENSSQFQNALEIRIAHFNVRIQSIQMLLAQNRNFELVKRITSVRALRIEILRPDFIILAFFVLARRIAKKSKRYVKTRLRLLRSVVANIIFGRFKFKI
jgi:glycosyltransferase involved in cell wall biosynthesis